MTTSRSQRIMILLACLAYYVFRGSARKKAQNIRSILIAPAGKLGDVVCATPMFVAMRKAYPRAHITLLGNNHTAGILANAGLYDEHINENENFWALLRQVRRGRYDFACLNGSSFLTLALFYLGDAVSISAPLISEFKPIQQTLPYILLSKFALVTYFKRFEYVPRLYLDLLQPAGINDGNTEKKLSFTVSARSSSKTFYDRTGIYFGQDRLIGITASAGNRDKEWPLQNFAKLIKLISSRNQAKIILFGSKADEDQGDKLTSMVPEVSIINSIGKFNIDELKAAISMLDLFIGVDTGPMYIAEAFKVPTIDIVGAVAEMEQPPRGPLHKVVFMPGRVPLMHVLDARDYDHVKARQQIEAITPEMVLQIFDEMWPEIKDGKNKAS